jgi:hypothetical protein
MASRKASIDALLKHADSVLAKIEAEYQESLHAKSIDAAMRIDIKNLCENLRSALDYLAHEVRESFCHQARADAKFYFPILPDQATFGARVDQWYPGLRSAAPSVVADLEAVQPYQKGFEWLGYLNKINNENKHGDLVEQIRNETVETRVTGQGGGQVSWGPGVTFGSGVSIMGVPIDPRTQLPVPSPAVKVERITWVDFQFAGIRISALALLKASVAGVRGIHAKLRPHLT